MLNVENISAFYSNKIKSQDQLIDIIEELKKNKKTVGLCVGSYDLLHPGHMKHFESAKKICDVLIIAVTNDYFVRRRKGWNRPVISERLRAYSIAQLESVDYVLISHYSRAVKLIKALQPSYYIKGSDYIKKNTPGIATERKAISDVNGEIRYTYDEKISTTELLRQIQKRSDKPVLLIGAGMAGVGKSLLLKEFSRKNSFVYIDKDIIDQSFLTTIKEGSIFDIDDSRGSIRYITNVKFQTYLTMLWLSEINLSLGFNVVLDGYFSDKLQIDFIENIISKLLKRYYVIKIYFTANKNSVFKRLKKRNFKRDSQKIKDFDSYYKKHNNDDLSQFDVVFNTDGDLSVNVDSLSHEIMNKIFGE